MQEYIKKLGSGNTTLIISNNEIEDIIKIKKPLGDSGLSLKEVTETVQNEVKEQTRGFLSTLFRYTRCKFIGKSFNRTMII